VIKRKGVTLIETMVVVVVLLLIALAAIRTIDPIELVNRARDAQRRKDLSRIKISFEDYFNDKGCYPNRVMVTSLTTKANCNSQVFLPWLPYWPCDPKGEPYKILIGDDIGCPKWFMMTADFESPKSRSVGTTTLGSGETTAVVIDNGGVTGGNVPEEVVTLDPSCWQGGCYYVTTSCNWIETCSGGNCYSGNCTPQCKVESCK
jgi:prepilin-type N-terminal cleavage/methylation domain-containing protein